MAERIAWVDFAKGVVIIFVVLGHAAKYASDLFRFIYVFHMPFFFVMAGFLLNLDKWGGAENYKAFTMKLVKRLLLPYYLAEFLFYPIWFVVCHEAGHLSYLWRWTTEDPFRSFIMIFVGNGNGQGLLLGQLWFLPTLLVTEIIFMKLYNLNNKLLDRNFFLAVLIFAFVAFVVNGYTVLPLGIDIAFAAQIFLLAGVLIRKYNVVERIDLKICVPLMVIVVAAFTFNGHVDMDFRSYGNPLLFYSGALSGTLIVMKLSALMTGGKFFSLISDCGRQSMLILILHPITANIFYELLVDGFNFPAQKLFTEPAVIFGAIISGALIPLFLAKKFGRLPVLKYFCA